MKKTMKIAAAVILSAAVLAAALLVYLSKRPAVPADYAQKTETGGPLEEKYLAPGPYSVSFIEHSVLQDFEKYEIFYPSETDGSAGPYPVVIFSNGTGISASKYRAVLSHLASWGFIVMATEEQNSWSGFSSEMCLRTVISLNSSEHVEGWDSNPLFGLADLDRVGVSGHSQGGVGAINAATENRHGSMVRAIFSASPTNLPLAAALQWDYDPGLVGCPVFLVSGTGSSDEGFVVSGAQLRAIYDAVPAGVTRVIARRTGAEHGDMLSCADGYMTAWFMWQLKGDPEAAAAFTGDSPELLSNDLYQDQEIDIPG